MIVTPYKKKTTPKKQQVAEMFDNIAGKYDFMNDMLSLRIHVLWRKKAINFLKKKSPEKILDIATGTGDFAIAAMKLNPEKIIGIDISEEMIKVGREKIRKKNLQHKIELLKGDSENILFHENSFDAVTVGFGVRNFENLAKGLKEMHRVLNPNGKVVILEFSKVKTFPMKQLYNFYFSFITPAIGNFFAKNKTAYSYLPESVNAFPDGENFLAILKQCGFRETKCYPLTFGIASIYTGVK